MAKKSKNRRVKEKPRRRKKAEPLVIRTLREQVRFLTKEYLFFKGKCERLELAVMEYRPGPSANYVARADQAARPPIDAVEVAPTGFKSVLSKWNSMSLEEQEEAIKDGNWDPEADTKH